VSVTALRTLLSLLLTLPMSHFGGDRNSDLVKAAKRGDPARVHDLLAKGADVDATDDDGRTSLMWAAQKGHREVVLALLDAGAKMDIVNRYRGTALEQVSLADDGELAGILLAHGAPVRNGTRLIHWAVVEGKAGLIRPLLRAGAKIDAPDEDGELPLGLAARLGQTFVATALLAAGADAGLASTRGHTPLDAAAATGLTELCRLILAKGGDANRTAPDGSTALMHAVVGGHWETAKLLVESGANPHQAMQDGATAFSLADEVHEVDLAGQLNDPTDSFGDGVQKLGSDDIQPPRVVERVEPSFAPSVGQRTHAGHVTVEAVVRPDGSVGASRVVTSIDLALDRGAVSALRSWRFAPATRDGEPVAVLIEVDFDLTVQLR
jgi:TonB family protein